jgi:hypothetical protein
VDLLNDALTQLVHQFHNYGHVEKKPTLHLSNGVAIKNIGSLQIRPHTFHVKSSLATHMSSRLLMGPLIVCSNLNVMLVVS